MTSNQGQNHQIWYESIDPKQGYYHANFEKPRLNSVNETANVKVLVKSETMLTVSLEYT